MPVKPKDLTKYGFDIVEEALRKSAFLAYPVMASKLGEGDGEAGGPEGDGSGGARGVEAAGRIS